MHMGSFNKGQEELLYRYSERIALQKLQARRPSLNHLPLLHDDEADNDTRRIMSLCISWHTNEPASIVI